jgi:hypothetical protein
MDSMRFDSADPQLCLLAPLAETPIEVQHRDELIFDDIISDMSFQGWEQDADDRRMIAANRDIFSNFYSVPTPHLDRQFLKELREFLMNGMSRFRWLLVGLHQDNGDLVRVFASWRDWRRERKGPFPDNNPTVYYAGPAFHSEFIDFVRTNYLAVAKAPTVVSGLLDYAAAFDPGLPANAAEIARQDVEPPPQDFGGLIGREVTPVVRQGVRITPVQADYQGIITALRAKSRLEDLTIDGSAIVATSDVEGEGSQVIQLSRHSSEILTLCDGVRTVADVGEQYRQMHEEVDGVPADLACIVGIEVLRRQGLVVLVSDSNRRPS